jgi:hypothetical protein
LVVEAAARVRPRALAVVRSIPAWAWVAGLVALSTGIRYATSRNTVAPWIMVDELIYSQLAESFAETGDFLLRGESTAAYGFVYPLLISPAWAVFDAVPDAYAAAKAINAVVMSLAAVPAYLLARRVLPPAWAFAAAALTVSVPPMLYTGMLMTENAFYPAFLLAALATVAWLERPTLLRTLLVIGACALAFLTRAQALAFLPALVTAPFLVSGRRAIREYRLLYGLAGIGVALVLIVQAARGASPFGIFGAYEVASRSDYTVEGVARWLLYHWSELVMALGVLPFAALVLLALTARGLPRPQRALVAATVAISFWLVLEVAAFASEQSLRVEERNMFYVAPLFLICLLVWVERGAPRPRWPAVAAAAPAAALPGFLPYSELIGLPAVSDTPALLPLWLLADSGVGLDQVRLVVVLASVAAGVLFLLVPRRYALVLPALVLCYFAVSQKPIDGKYRQASVLDLFAGITVPNVDWIDRAVGRDARVAAIWSGNTDRYSIWENEFFNRSLRDFYYTNAPLAGDLPEQPLRIDRSTGFMRGPDGEVVHATHVLTDGSVALQGTVITRDARKGMLLYLVGGPLRQIARVEGLYPQDTWSTDRVTYTRLDCPGGTLAVELQSDPGLFDGPQTVRAFVGGREVASVEVPPRVPRTLRVPLEPRAGVCVASFTISPTAVPAEVTGGANPDPRALGIHFNRFVFSPEARTR